jgi:hypothetical protein
MRLEYLRDRGFGQKQDEFRLINVALDGQPVEFWLHESDWRRLEGTSQFEPFLINQAASILELESQGLRT